MLAKTDWSRREGGAFRPADTNSRRSMPAIKGDVLFVSASSPAIFILNNVAGHWLQLRSESTKSATERRRIMVHCYEEARDITSDRWLDNLALHLSDDRLRYIHI